MSPSELHALSWQSNDLPTAKELVNTGYRHLFGGDGPDAAVAAFEEVLRRFGECTDVGFRQQVAKALNGISYVHVLRDEAEASLAVSQQVLRMFPDPAAHPQCRRDIVEAVKRCGDAYGDLGRLDEALAYYDRMMQVFGHDTEPVTREQVAMGWTNKGAKLSDFGRVAEAISVFEDVIARYSYQPEPDVQFAVATSMSNLARNYLEIGRHAEALRVCDDMLGRFAASPDSGVQSRVARVRDTHRRVTEQQKPSGCFGWFRRS